MELFPQVRSLIESQVCEVHDEHANLLIVDGKVVIECCCAEFKLKCYSMKIHFKENIKPLSIVWKKAV
jgi:hypothetical protein